MEYTIQTYELCKKYGGCSVVRNVSMHVKNYLSIERIKRQEASVIEIYDLKYGTLELNSRLFAAGFAVAEISKCRNSLEDYFKELTGGAGIA